MIARTTAEKLIFAMNGVPVVRDGNLWFATMPPDSGLLLVIGDAKDPRFAKGVRGAKSLDLTASLAPPPGLAETTLERECAHYSRIGAVKVQTRFVDHVLARHPLVSWMAPSRSFHGPCRATVDGRVVALVMGIAESEDEVAEARKRRIVTMTLSESEVSQ